MKSALASIKSAHASDEVLRWAERLLRERINDDVRLVHDDGMIVLRMRGHVGQVVFSVRVNWRPETPALLPCSLWHGDDGSWELPFSLPVPTPGHGRLPERLIELQTEGNCATVHLDFIGLMYWLLCRIEEVDRSDRDTLGRLPAAGSHADIHGYLERPVLDEWIFVLRQVIQRQWPGISFLAGQFRTAPTHDVDRPSRFQFGGLLNFFGRMSKDLVFGQPQSIPSGLMVRFGRQDELATHDPYNTFEWIMDASERAGLISTFYFMAGHRCERRNADYRVDHPAIIRLLREIDARGHQIGLHPSYDAYRDAASIGRERRALERALDIARVSAPIAGTRMHYLRWDHIESIRALIEAGIHQDATLGYADAVGFRCGTCHNFEAFDPLVGRPLPLQLQPLIAMECSLFRVSYMGLGLDDAIRKLQVLKTRCQRVGGTFSMLWHNHELVDGQQRLCYLKTLGECS